MDIGTYNNLGGAIEYRFPNKYDYWEVVQNHLGIFLTEWNESELGPQPNETTMLQWIQEFESLTEYEQLTRIAKDKEDVKLEFVDRPILRQLLKADRQTISDEIDLMTTQQLKNLLKILVIAVRMLVRQSLGD